MGIAYLCKPDRKLAVVVWDGIVTWDVWREHLERMFMDTAWAPMEAQISDMRHSTADQTITITQIQEMVALLAAQRQRVALKKVAILAGSDWEKPKEAEGTLPSVSVLPIVFNDLSTACVWLGADVGEVERDVQQLRLKLRSSEQP